MARLAGPAVMLVVPLVTLTVAVDPG